MNREGKKCVLYSRVSTEMQVDGFSLEGQITRMKTFAEREEMDIVKRYEDAGKSGKSIAGRPAFQSMLADIQEGKQIDYILVYKLSRFGRNAADILNSLQKVQDYGVNLISVEEGIDSSQASGKLLISVLSAVAEIERENILEQTMNGRKEKARQGLWNGGPAPYGYLLKDDTLIINEQEAEVVRLIYDKFANTDMGYNGVAKYLNLQGIAKNKHKESDITVWSARSVQCVLDNPVYVGKIAYGRRIKEKIKGSRDDYRTVRTSNYLVYDGKHDALVDQKTWEKVREKRNITGFKSPSRVGRERIHLLTGLLKCPKCGSPMYCNRHSWQKKDGTYKDVYYYYCGHNGNPRGYVCNYKAKLRTTDIEPYVVEAIKELIRGESFAKEIESRIGQKANTEAIDTELKNYKKKLIETETNKANLEETIDNLPLDTKYRERKLKDMSARLDSLYDTIKDLEECIEDASLRRAAMEEEALTLDNVYKLLLSFDKIYDIMTDKEKKDLISYLIKDIQIYSNEEQVEMPLKSITLNFPIYSDSGEVNKLLWENQDGVDSFDVLFKTLPYQILSSRVNGKTAFYQAGGATGFRDMAQDTLSLAYFDKLRAREELIKLCNHVYFEGDVMHWWHGEKHGVRTRISDDGLFLAYAVANYVKISGDRQILDETAAYLDSPCLAATEESRFEIPKYYEKRESVLMHLERIIERAYDVGENGLLKIRGGDWNDALNAVGTDSAGESVWLSEFYIAVLKEMSAFYDSREKTLFSERINTLEKAVLAAYENGRFKRLVTASGEWLGDGKSDVLKIDAISEAWAALSGISDKNKVDTALTTAKKCLFDKKNGLFLLLAPPFDDKKYYGYISLYPKGVRENGGQYTHGAIWFILALIECGRADEAYEIFKAINPVEKCKDETAVKKYMAEPYVLAADVYSGENIGRAGWTWYTGSASWCFKTMLEGFLGVSVKEGNIVIDPAPPKALSTYDVIYDDKKSKYIFHFAPSDKYSVVENGVDLGAVNAFPIKPDENREFFVRYEESRKILAIKNTI